ncbi:glycoside hydrolase family 2 TIM barrel-domain containing protein [Mangrovibacterium diazotrophicum]|uniref:Beta-galactosidase n=1 Tax=Mangrovibacterium diazotrophicum TaxID=1261403 RepID=A0A419W671_9BACT|nr:glycoside hydrolase family 2 TIM barrel-domain containing protein [Mangrovibacterium diazotrophicum]RKD90946.1 beta-galactosidase [Mangrovibacterium diazotrophicum]
MKIKLAALALMLLSFSVKAQERWQDPKVNEVNREPMHSAFFAYESEDAAEAGVKESSTNFMSLNGTWKFNWVQNARQRPTDFYSVGLNDKGWGEMPVPGLWELNGYGDPQYVNIGYGWREQYKNNPPIVPEENNHVGSYRKEIELPANWSGKEIYAHFGSVTSNISLYVNGKFVGYSEDSKLEAEFNLTKYLKPGKNLIAFQSFRWCDGSYLEDQDFWRFSGVGRDCYLFAREKTHMRDLKVTPDLVDDYTDGTLTVKVDLTGKASVSLKLTDQQGNTVAEKQVSGSGEVTTEIEVENPAKWTAETPVLYNLTATLTQSGSVKEVIPVKVGFRKVEMKNNQLCVNGQPILIKGVNRHELDPDGGYVVSPERMEQDIQMMKKFNVNAVRTCHYPDNSLWYDLCDKYGIYVVAEANLESHGMGYGPETLAKNPAYAKAHLERNERNVLRNFNHPAVIIWSMGNEAGFGPNFEACYEWIKGYDTSRPVQYEQAKENDYTDIFCPMYYDYNNSEKYAQSDKKKPLIQCEYAHAMGNSEGGFKEYWDLIRKYPLYQGGFIWDFVDQSIHWKNKDGQLIYAYGGDFNPYDASDNNFLDNGLISPDRKPNPHYYEVGYYYQSIWTSPVDLASGQVEIYNEYFFRDLSNFYLQWELVADGKVIKTGLVDNLAVLPHEKTKVDLGLTVPVDLQAKEVFVNVAYKLKDAEQLLPADYTLARQQLAVKDWAFEPIRLENKTLVNQKTAQPTLVENDLNYLLVTGENFQIDFNRKSGYLCRYLVDGKPVLEAGTVLKPNFWRSPTDNDLGAELQLKYAVWKDPKIELKSLNVTTTSEGLVEVKADYDMPEVGGKLQLIYQINNEGAVAVSQKLTAGSGDKVSEMFRFGMKLEMPQDYQHIKYYGRGPGENYIDRKDSEFIGLYDQSVCEQPYAYIRPQETGTKSDVRWWAQTAAGGKGLCFKSDAAYSISALNYSVESLDDGLEKDQRHFPEVRKSDFVTICIDKKQMGMGCVTSWGAVPRPEYRIPYQDMEFNFLIKPVAHVFTVY